MLLISTFGVGGRMGSRLNLWGAALKEEQVSETHRDTPRMCRSISRNLIAGRYCISLFVVLNTVPVSYGLVRCVR